MKVLLAVLLVSFIFVLSLVIGAQNDQIVEVNYFIAKSELQLSSLMALLLGSGFMIGCIVGFLSWLKLRLRYNHLIRKSHTQKID
ncbi:lipopolysaccharide assembly protein LapA domain-containing protein [Aestuariibacter sp. AA17]|uniref:Probable lipopolysaccharide assembly protein A n=1 Tax=Fluctibacter corallii TaxID=2984329 RepID=A0ABT3A5W1_9ALTE|nr:lipopolysaccharide assembly protein LapA domain-containing protein [Aestuariibacter sp. AA17]MCV2884070.1 lipopolysaccharide assembly protein LapA domain-containing protein [Aestuariibacter sp. AA17]